MFADESPVLAGHHASDGATANVSLCVCVWNLLYLLVIMRVMVQQITPLCVFVFTDESDVFAGEHSDGATDNASLCVCVCR